MIDPWQHVRLVCYALAERIQTGTNTCMQPYAAIEYLCPGRSSTVVVVEERNPDSLLCSIARVIIRIKIQKRANYHFLFTLRKFQF
jgi:hypothetical protein